MINKHLAVPAAVQTDYAAAVPACIANGYTPKLSVADLLIIAEQPKLARISEKGVNSKLEIHLGQDVWVPASQLNQCIDYQEFSADDALARSYLRQVLDHRILTPENVHYFDDVELPVDHSQMSALLVNDFPGIATLRAYTCKLDSYTNTWSNPNHLHTLLTEWRDQEATINQIVRSSIWHTIMVNDGINTVKALTVLNRLISNSGNPEIKSQTLFSAQCVWPSNQALVHIPQYVSATPVYGVAKGFHRPHKVIYCIRDAESHVDISSFSACRHEREFSIQSGEQFRIVPRKDPWLTALQQAHPDAKLVGLEPLHPSDWSRVESLSGQYAKRPWLIEKLIKLAWLLNQPEVAARILKEIPEVQEYSAQCQKRYGPDSYSARLKQEIDIANGALPHLSKVVKMALKHALYPVALEAALAISKPSDQAVACIDILNAVPQSDVPLIYSKTLAHIATVLDCCDNPARDALLRRWLMKVTPNLNAQLLPLLLCNIQRLPAMQQTSHYSRLFNRPELSSNALLEMVLNSALALPTQQQMGNALTGLEYLYLKTDQIVYVLDRFTEIPDSEFKARFLGTTLKRIPQLASQNSTLWDTALIPKLKARISTVPEIKLQKRLRRQLRSILLTHRIQGILKKLSICLSPNWS